MERVALAALAALIGAGCASPPSSEVSVRVHNRTGGDIASIQMKECGGAETAFAPLPRTELGPGRAVTIGLPDTCVDLVARDRRGRVVAEQHGLHALPDTTWSIR